MRNPKKVIVVGGGVAGILAALLHRQKGNHVTLIEKSNHLGGLLNSVNYLDSTAYFDNGTHFLARTGIHDVDTTLFTGFDYHEYDFLKVGNYYNELNENNAFISDKSFPDADAYLSELIDINNSNIHLSNYTSLEEQLISTFGKGYSYNVLFPVVKKFYHTAPSKLAPDSHRLLGLGRISVSTSDHTKELKKDPLWDDKIAFHSFTEGISPFKSLYPVQGGCGSWINCLEEKLIQSNVGIHKGSSINSLHLSDKYVTSVFTQNDEFQCDHLVWASPPNFLINLLGNDFACTPVKRLTSSIYHFIVNKNYITDLHFLYCYDPSFKTFRVTLYENFSSGNPNQFRITVEVLESETLTDNLSNQDLIFNELIQMKVIDPNCKIIFSNSYNYLQGFPVITKDFLNSSNEASEYILDRCKNVFMYGKSSSKSFGMIEIFNTIHNSINSYFD